MSDKITAVKLGKALDMFAEHGEFNKSISFIVDGIDMHKEYPLGSQEQVLQKLMWEKLEDK